MTFEDWRKKRKNGESDEQQDSRPPSFDEWRAKNSRAPVGRIIQSGEDTNSVNNTRIPMTEAEWQRHKNRNNSAGGEHFASSYQEYLNSFNNYSTLQTPQSADDWAKESIALVNEIQDYYGSWKAADYDTYYQYHNKAKDLLLETDRIKNQFSADNEAVSYIDAVAEALSAAQSNASTNYESYSQFKTKEEYDNALEQWQEYHDTWGHYADKEDFADHSGYVSTALDSKWDKAWSQYSMGYGDLTYEYINNQDGIRDKINSKSRAFRSDTKDGGSVFEDNHYDYMTTDEVSTYNYIYATEGKDGAQKFLDAIGETLEARANNKTIENVAKFANEHPVIASALSIGTSLGSGFEYIEDAIEYGKDKIVGNPAKLGPNESALITNTVRSTVSEQVDWEIRNWDAFDFLYSTAMSGADSLAAGFIFGNYSGVALGLSAAAQGTNDALARGMSDGQAFWNGLISGVFEGLFETVSVGNFNKLKEIAPNSIKDIFKNLGKSMLVNASEETLTEIANIGYDTLINGEFANYTWEELKNGAWKDALGQVLEAGASGALMGVGMGSVGNAIGYYKGGKAAEKVYGSDPGALVTKALEIDPNNAFAQKMQRKLDSGSKLSGGQMNRLVQQNEVAMTAQDKASIQNAAESRLTELGETGDVSAIASVLTKQASGEKLTRAERKMIAESKYGQRVANELKPINIRSGSHTSQWAENIGTQKINPLEYSRMIEATQKPQETAEVTGEQVAAEAPKAVQAVQTDAVTAPVATAQGNQPDAQTGTTAASYQQVTEKSSATDEVEAKTVTLEDASKKYGAQAQAMIHTYTAGQDVAKYDAAYQIAYDMGKSGVSFEYVKGSQSVSYLTDSQKEFAYEAGKAASNTEANNLASKNKAATNGKTGRRKGTVKGEGVTIADLKKTFNDTQGKAYKYLSTVAEVTGIDIVLYRSEADAVGKFQGTQGRYSRSEPGTIYIDLNAGLSDINSADDLAKYAMLRTFAHEFTHFIENWNPIQYNELRKVVFDTLTERGENVNDLIEDKQARNPGMSYDEASREVVAEAMTDILPDAKFVQELAENHKTIFQKLLDQLKEFVANLRDYFNSIGHNRSKEANAIKEQVGDTVKYLDSIVQLFDKAAVQAVENYQQGLSTEGVIQEVKKHEERRESRKETREAFYGRAGKASLEVRERGSLAFGYRRYSGQLSQNVQAAEEGLKKIGIPVVVFEQMEGNKNGITMIYNNDALAIPGVAVFIHKDASVDALEIVGHEGYHYFATSKKRTGYREVVAANIDFASKAFVDYQQKYVGDIYFAEDVEIGSKEWDTLIEEVFAYIAGDIHNGDPKGEVHRFLRDYDAVKSAWDALVEARVKKDGTQNQDRTETLTDREVLAMAASQVKVDDLTGAEKDALDIFRKRLSKLESLQNERAEQGRLYKEQQFGTKVDRAKATETLNRMHVLDGKIQKASAEVLTVEEKTVLKRVLQKARTVVEQQERQHGQEILKRWRERRNDADAIKKYRDRLRGDVDELTNWVLHPDNKNIVKHIPDALKNTVIPFLSSINFASKRSLAGGNPTQADKALMEQTRKLAKVMENTVDIDEMYSNYTDLPPDFMKNLRSFMDTAQEIIDSNSGDFIINQMTAEELQKLSKVVRTLKKYIMTMNRFHVNSMFKHVYEAGENSIDFLAELKPAENTGAVSQFLLWQQMRPAYAFERFGDGGMAVYDGLRRGQATLAFNTKKIIEFSEKAYTTAEVKAWENEVKTIRIGPGKTVKMRVSQIMSLYELNKREQAQGHILGEGIRVATFKNGKQKISDIGQTLTPGELDLILRELTPRQKEVADNLQQFMEKQGGEWGNYVTVARFGEKQFGEKNYFPINSDGRHLQVDADEKPGAAALYALLNMSFTKQTQEKAKNRIVIYSIFDVFSNHMASMAQYNAFALPVVDVLKWFNYQRVAIDDDGSKTILGSVREQMDRAYGVPEENRPGSGRKGYAQAFVINILKAFNGTESQGVPTDTMGIEALHRYNVAQVAYNFRVVVQQPLAITRAALLIDYGSIIKGMKLQPAAIRKNIQEMQQYSGIAAWKSLGFYDVNISRGLTNLIKHDTSAIDKINDVGMWGAEKADLLTWAGIWSACKEEVIKKQKLTPKSEGFYDAVTQLFEEVIYKTQVVDSVLTKNEYLRSKGLFARLTGSFMSEPTTTASMLINAYDKYHADIQRGMTRQQAWKKNRRMIGRTAYVYGLSAAILAAVQAVADAFRDDDDYQEWYEKWLEAFGGNLIDELMPFNKLPIVSDFYDLAKELLSTFGVDTYGNPPQSVFMQWYDSLVKGVEILYDRISGEETNYTWYGGAYKLLQAISGITGLPMAAATREIVTAWNNIVGSMAPSLKVKTYEPSEMAKIKYAYQDGYLTAEEATEQLLQQGLVDTEDEAYFIIQGWEVGDGYSRYDAIFDAVRNGGDFNAAMRELTSHGYAEKDVLSQVKSQIGDWYKGGEITKQQAINMLTKYMDMASDDITATVNKWSSKVVTGIAFEDIKDEFIQGNITAQRAIDMYVLYGGYTKDKATETVTKWRAEKETGVGYDDIKDAFLSGEISQGDAKNMYITYGGLTEEKATENAYVLAFIRKYPESDGISYAAAVAYNTYCEASGVPVKTYYDAWKYKSNAKADEDADGESISGSKKEKVLNYINNLNLTRRQKDSLYYAFGWAESTLDEAPWH